MNLKMDALNWLELHDCERSRCNL